MEFPAVIGKYAGDPSESGQRERIVKIRGFRFENNLSLLNQAASLGFEVEAPLDSDVAAALASDTEAFPSRDVELSEIRLEAATPKPIEFGRGQDKISFTSRAGRFSSFGVYRTGSALLAKLGDGAVELPLSAREFEADSASIWSVLRWGYDAEGKVSGAMALGAAAKAALAVSGEGEGFFAIIRRLPAAMPARRVVQSVADGWILPRQIFSAEQVPPGTWIVAEATGSVSIRLATQLGYRFNWVRETRLGGLSGDIGLRLQAAINAAVGYSAGGRCAVVISRDSDQKVLRLRLFRLGNRKLDVALDGKLNIQAVDRVLPEKIDDFIAAVFDCHGLQVLRDLKRLGKWTDPQRPLPSLLAEVGLEGAEKLIAFMAGIPADELQSSLDLVYSKVVRFLAEWHDLPHALSAALLKMIADREDLADVRDLVRRLSTITPEGLRVLLNLKLDRLISFHTPVGLFLEAAADKGVLSLLSMPISYVQGIGKKVSAILDQDALEGVLIRFQEYMEAGLNLGKAMQAADDAGFAGLDDFLKRRLARFLGLDKLTHPDLDKVRRTIGLLLSKQQEFYEKALQALHRKWRFELEAAYQSATVREALLDAEFDFSRDPGSVGALFEQAVQGRWEDLLVTHHPQIKIGAGKISHGTRRRTQIDVTLPFLRASQSHLNESLASAEIAAADGELLFTLNSTDAIAGHQGKSILSLVLNLPDGAGVRIHDSSLEMQYTLLYAKRGIQRRHLLAQAGPAVRTYFREKIPDLGDFIDLIDRHAEEVLPNGPNLLGDGLISLQVSLSEAAARLAGRAWLSLPPDRRNPVYRDMSVAIQSSLKQLVHDGYFTEPERYQDLETARVVLAYCSLEPACGERGDMPLWDSADPEMRRRMLGRTGTLERMERLMERACGSLADDPDSGFFNPSNARKILENIDPRHWVLDRLLQAESQIVRHALEAGFKIGVFMERKGGSPSAAVAALAAFASALTEAFHASLTPLLSAGFRSLGTRLFLDVCRAIDPNHAGDLAEINAMLSLELLRSGARFDEASLLKSGMVHPDLLAVADRVVQLG